MRKFKILFVSCLIFLTFILDARAKEVINFATWLPPSDPMNSVLLPKWAKMVKEATNGRIEVKIERYVGHPKDLFDLVQDGVYTGSWSFHGYAPGRFKLTKIVELPGLNTNAEKASGAYWTVYQKYLKKANEHDGLYLIALFTHGPGQIIMRKPIFGLDDMKGKKIRVGGGIQSDIAQLMGVTAVPAPGSKVYEILQTGVADGVFMPVGQQAGSKLSEVAKFLYLLPGGMYLGSFAIFLNPEFVASLSPKDRKALLSTTGKKLSEMTGKAWDYGDKLGMEAAKKAGNTIVNAPLAEVEKFNDMVKSLDKKWLEEVADSGVDANKALKELKELVKE